MSVCLSVCLAVCLFKLIRERLIASRRADEGGAPGEIQRAAAAIGLVEGETMWYIFKVKVHRSVCLSVCPSICLSSYVEG